MNLTYFDAHAHIHDDKYKNQIPNFFDSLKEKNIGAITVGTDIVESRKAVSLAEENENIWATIGVHPGDNQSALFLEEEFSQLAKSKKCVGVGECGLDYFFLKQDKEKGKIENIDREIDRQRDLFITQIEFAVKYDLPLMIHGRPSKKDDTENPRGMDAYEDIIFILKKMQSKYGAKVRGNMHFFVGDIDIAKECLSLGFTFSLGGVLTITEDYHDMVRFLPLESILTETDSPYVTPKIHRGKINSPEYIPAIIDKIAEIKGLTTEEVRLASLSNVKRVFGI